MKVKATVGNIFLASIMALVAAGQSADAKAPAAAVKQTTQSKTQLDVPQWFNRYDQIRREAQMTPDERKQASTLLSGGVKPWRPENEKQAAKRLLTKLTAQYRKATMAMKALPMLPQTQKLHRGYYQYFSTAGDLFADYLTVQDNLLAKDKTTGRPLLGELLERKEKLSQLNDFIQDLDKKARNEFDIPAYKYVVAKDS